MGEGRVPGEENSRCRGLSSGGACRIKEKQASEQRLGEQAEKGRRRLARSLEPDYTGICIPYLRIWGFKIIKEF